MMPRYLDDMYGIPADAMSDYGPEPMEEGEQYAWLPRRALAALKKAGHNKAISEVVEYERAARRANFKPHDPSRVNANGEIIYTPAEEAEARKYGVWDKMQGRKAGPKHKMEAGGHLDEMLTSGNPRAENYLTKDIYVEDPTDPGNVISHKLALERNPLSIESLSKLLRTKELDRDIAETPNLRGMFGMGNEALVGKVNAIRDVERGSEPKESILKRFIPEEERDAAREASTLKFFSPLSKDLEKIYAIPDQPARTQEADKAIAKMGNSMLEGSRRNLQYMEKEPTVQPKLVGDWLAPMFEAEEDMPRHLIGTNPIAKEVASTYLENANPSEYYRQLINSELPFSEYRRILNLASPE